jgi:hypothetical protein
LDWTPNDTGGTNSISADNYANITDTEVDYIMMSMEEDVKKLVEIHENYDKVDKERAENLEKSKWLAMYVFSAIFIGIAFFLGWTVGHSMGYYQAVDRAALVVGQWIRVMMI